MGDFVWLQEHLAGVLNAVGIVGGLFFTAFSFRAETRERKLSNMIALTQAHRDIWSRSYEDRDLSRILEKDLDLTACPVTGKEELFITFLILHLNCMHRAISLGMFPELEGLRKDISEFYSLPIPNEIWKKLKPLQDRAFVGFVDSALTRKRRRWWFLRLAS